MREERNTEEKNERQGVRGDPTAGSSCSSGVVSSKKKKKGEREKENILKREKMGERRGRRGGRSATV
uniref:Uncharacterized protein n=1 Tax=Nelumbo nucifera TaxID=4432 RepID=A0A822XLS5_NELNU|nr:TPA_asm: hypothetical protein HUJ06_021208 [Nelumbo nucifera]